MANVSCSTSEHKAREQKEYSESAFQRLTCDYQLVGFYSWALALAAHLRLCRKVCYQGEARFWTT